MVEVVVVMVMATTETVEILSVKSLSVTAWCSV